MAATHRRNLTTAVTLFAVAGGMVGLAFASVPLYRLFCQVTGFGGTPGIEAAAPAAATAGAPKVVVRFDANVNGGLPWRFRPAQREMTVAVGEEALAFYTARNESEEAVTGTATFNVTPFKAGPYFNKVQCFCFTEQRLEPGEEVSMAVSFFVDPEILKDTNTTEVRTITLSYTFFRAKGEDGAQTAGQPGAARGKG
jgi:cytochrome c oxidase assembly protein subunit 11